MVRIGRYHVIRRLGSGGMGDVYLAHDPTLERDVALKLLRRDATQSGLRDEARALAALSHPGIVTIFEIGAHDGQDFIAMEYLRGRPLRQLLVERAPRALLLAVCANVALAVEAAHRAGILHRDIKPENIVVDAEGGVKVVDFGLARRVEPEGRRSNRAITARDELVEQIRRTLPPDAGTDTLVDGGTQALYGTPAYMAPEVLVGVPSSEASDVYSLGVVLHECITGRRPHDASSIIEAIALIVDGPAAALADPFGELVARMLRHDHRQRPQLAEVARALAPKPELPAVVVAPRRRWPVIAVTAAAACTLAIGGWQLAREVSPPPAAAPAAAPAREITASIAVAPFTIHVPSYGSEGLHAAVVADTLARLLGEVEGARLRAITVTRPDHALARATGAAYLVTGSIVERAGALVSEIELISLATGAVVERAKLEQPLAGTAPLLDLIASQLAHAVAPGSRLPQASGPMRAKEFHRQGAKLLRDGKFTEARPYFEQAVDADPRNFDGWYGLALVLAWMEAPEDQVLTATAKARALAAGPKAELMRGVALFLEGELAQARTALEAVERTMPADAPERVELLYYLGEANWHDGRHVPAFAYFEQAIALDSRFRPAAVHAWQYAVGHRLGDQAQRYLAIGDASAELGDFALRKYARLAESPGMGFASRAVLGRPSAQLEQMLTRDDLEADVNRVALAIGDGDLAAARTRFAALWARWIADRPAVGGTLYQVEALGELVISAALVAETRRVVEYLAAQSRTKPARGYHRLAILAAPLLGEPALLRHAKLTERNLALAAAGEAELAGDRDKAVTVLDGLVADPTVTWDYPERAALLRNLRALRRRRPVTALCRDTVEPAVFRPAYFALRRACRR